MEAGGASSGRPFAGRADLLRVYLEQGEAAADALAHRLGYRARPVVRRRRTPGVETDAAGAAADGADLQPTPVPSRFASVPLWRVVHREWQDQVEGKQDSEGGSKDAEPPAEQGLHPEDLEPGDQPPPSSRPIAPWPALRRALDHRLRTPRPRRRLDVEALVRRWARGRNVVRLPQLQGLAHARLALIVDDSPRLAPWVPDLLGLVASLARRLAPHMLRFLPPPSRLGRGGCPAVGRDEIVLALSDLGHYGSEGQRFPWYRLGHQLRRRGDRFLALVPVSRRRQETALAGLWSAVDWGAVGGAGAAGPKTTFDGDSKEPEPPKGSELLLTAIAPALRVEAPLLRDLRRRLPEVDLGCEVEVWNHPQVRGSSSAAICIDLQAAPAWQLRFAQLPLELRQAVAETLIDGHRHLPPPIRLAEALQLREAGIDVEVFDPELADAAGFLQRAAHTLEEQAPEDSPLGQQVDAYWQRFRQRAASRLYHAQDLQHTLARVEAVLRARHPELLPPAGSNPAMLPGDRPPRHWTLWQEGPQLRARAKGEPGQGSPLLDMVARRLRVEDGQQPVAELDLDGDAEVPWPASGALKLVSDLETVTSEVLPLPSWATGMGRDRYGLWADLKVEAVVQRLRWMPPGRFVMGSPPEEAGRWDDEGPQHEVILSRGFWLGETPCTQALWQAVMGENPSECKSPQRPVETVSWDEVQGFLTELQRRELPARLPNEAQWEYACRAGTTTATWLGELEILGACHAPLLDGIAWYAGNSGWKYDLEKGFDSSDWPEKQYDHQLAGSREVKTKAANPWGLYDMLGNVDEWCQDWQSGYGEALAVDPEGPKEGVNRVIRGGSWYGYARHVRAAYRRWDHAGDRDDSLGFRLALGGGLGRGAASESGPRSGEGSAPRSGGERSEGIRTKQR